MRRIITKKDAVTLQSKFPHGPKSKDPSIDEIKISRFNPDRAGAGTETPSPDDYLSRLQKLIPAEIVAAFLTVDALVKNAKKVVFVSSHTISETNGADISHLASISPKATQSIVNMVSPNGYWIIFCVIVFLCAAYARKMATTPALGTSYKQVTISTVAFVVWTYAIGGPFSFANVSWWNPAVGGIAVTLYTLATPLAIK